MGVVCKEIDELEKEKEAFKMSDNPIESNHYNNSCSLSCLDMMKVVFGDHETFIFCLTSAFKYIWRFKDKNGMEDLDKARWYLDYVKFYMNDGKKYGVKVSEFVRDLHYKMEKLYFETALRYREEVE